MKKLNEADIRKLLKKKFGNNNVHKLAGLRIRGVLDCLLPVEGRALFLEIKIDGDKLTATQKLFLKMFPKSSGVLYWNNKTRVVTYEGPKQFESVLEAMTE